MSGYEVVEKLIISQQCGTEFCYNIHKTERGGKHIDSRTKALEAAQAALDKKAKETVILELKDLTIIADYFVICSGESTTQVKAIVENIDKRLKEHRQRPSGVEGLNSARWVLMDYGDVIVHVFEEDTRAYYELEKFWLDAPKIAVEDKAVKTAAGSKKQYV